MATQNINTEQDAIKAELLERLDKAQDALCDIKQISREADAAEQALYAPASSVQAVAYLITLLVALVKCVTLPGMVRQGNAAENETRRDSA